MLTAAGISERALGIDAPSRQLTPATGVDGWRQAANNKSKTHSFRRSIIFLNLTQMLWQQVLNTGKRPARPLGHQARCLKDSIVYQLRQGILYWAQAASGQQQAVR